MRTVDIYRNFIHKTGSKARMYWQKPAKSRQAKALINRVIGEGHIVVRPIEDFGGFSSLKQLVSCFTTHYAAFRGTIKRKFAFAKYYTHHIALNYDENKNVQKLRIYNVQDKDVSIYDKFGNMVKHYSPEEVMAIQSYKHNSKEIHKFLRYGEHLKNENEVRKTVDIISNIFRFHYKTERAPKSFYVYRALDSKALNTIMAMSKDGMVYIEPSFLSVSTKKRSILQFLRPKNFRHILRLKVYEGARYLDVDKMSMGHIIQPQLAENELIFDKDSKILIKTRKGKYGFIDAELLRQ